jgi:hypothetical protein
MCIVTLSGWFKRCHAIEKKFESFGLIEVEIAEPSTLDEDLVKRRAELEERFGVGVISLVIEDKFWLV